MEANKITIKEEIRNCIYIFKQAFCCAPLFFILYIFFKTIVVVIDSVTVILIYRYLINGAENNVMFSDMVKTVVLFGGGLGIVSIAGEAGLNKWYEITILSVRKKMNDKLYRKANSFDISVYDDSEFYDKFVRAIGEGDAQITAAVESCLGILSTFISISSISAILLSIDRIMVIFPLIACVIHMITEFSANRFRYSMQVESTKCLRIRDYCQRVFYQPEYSQELRMTGISAILKNLFEGATMEEENIARKYGKKIQSVMFFNDIFGWVLQVHFLPMEIMIYHSLVSNRISVGDVAALNETNQSLVNRLDGLARNFVNLQNIGLFGGLYREFAEWSYENHMGTMKIESKGMPKKLELRNVSFSYQEGKKALDNISMSIEPGSKIAIVGYNGSGKSTLTKLLMNLYSPQEGEILYDDVNLRQIDWKEYINCFGILLQDYQIYALSIEDNIKMGRKLTSDINDAIDKAEIDRIISSLPDKEESNLTREFDDQGVLLSGGEQQRVALARLFMEKHPLIILDEPTSAMDPITEKKINDTIFSEFADSTVIYISHHLTTTKNADHIYYFENGRIIEDGTHEELMEKQGKYSLMFAKQSSYYLNPKGNAS